MTILVDSDVSEDWDSVTAWPTLAERAVLAAVAHSDFPGLTDTEVSVKFTSDAEVRALNAAWRGKDKATNVLSFPAFPLSPGGRPGPMLGDIIMAEETLRREALDLGIPFDDHLTHLLVHGFLHLFGYDHMTDEEATVMEGLETRILAEMGLADPYGE
jgi:probable rRNA maturation factor